MRVEAVSGCAVCVGAIVALAACGVSPGPSGAASPSPSSDPVTTNYVALIHHYWIQYKTAEGDLDHISPSNAPFGTQDAARVCFGYASPTDAQDINLVDPPSCGKVAAAMRVVHEKFLSDLNATPAPPKLAAEDQAFRMQLPKAVAAMQGMISAAAGGNKQSVVDATAGYISAMIPIVTDALDTVDPSVVHN